GFIDINKAPFKVFIFSMSTLKGAFHIYFLSVRFFDVEYKKAQLSLKLKVTKQITKGDNAPMNNVILNTFDLKV
ncbi:hypothetical protein, partial [Staphylococcus aureus]|uniref:hypothetical protein n=1 Tax=Staphylococcus aureus TaxID=1280 RepID=UPI001C92E815